jgi:hypothetical protein
MQELADAGYRERSFAAYNLVEKAAQKNFLPYNLIKLSHTIDNLLKLYIHMKTIALQYTLII